MSRIDQINQFLETSPNDSFLQHALALEYIKLGEEERAKILFETLLKREPGYIGSYYHLAHLLERLGNRTEAIACYEKGMEEAKKAGETHALNELRAAYEELVF
jgi:Tfp pilus assembly protein PilF